MALTIMTNTASLSAQRNLASTQKALAGNVARLSSGMRINQASDDAAGLGISEKMKAQLGSLEQAGRNANDGISMIQVAEGAMNEQAGILTRLRELATQSANGTLGSTERGFITTEKTQLLNELDRISAVTDFNGVKMLGANAGSVSFQVGTGATTNDSISVTFDKTDATTLGVNGIDLSSASGAQSALSTIDSAIDKLSTSRANIGAVQNRLNVTVTNLASAHENVTAANSRIRDVDVAAETSMLTRNQILSQAGIAVLAQANQLPSMALSLLRG
ncbi:MAG TPA: flagellin [Haliangiales bacterium]|nr:flagellin [Haliangiales bacterium]